MLNSNLNFDDSIHYLFPTEGGFYGYCTKRAGIVTLHLYVKFTDTYTSEVSNYIDIGLTLPEGYSPSGVFFVAGYDDLEQIIRPVQFNSYGSIKPYGNNDGNTKRVLLNVSFAV